MATRNINTQNLLCVKLLQLRRHFGSCKQCRAARTGRDYDALCGYAKMELIEVAVKWDNNIGKRLAARNGNHAYIFPCPDTNAHGPLYSLTADAVIVDSVQDKLL